MPRLLAAPHVAVAGAGIGGLASALALARAGCRVTVFERDAAWPEVGAGVQLSPNACAVLDGLGLLGALATAAVEPAEVLIRRGRDGAALARIPLGARARARYGFPSLVALRADLQRALRDAVAGEGRIAVELGRPVEDYRDAGRGVEVRLPGAARDFDALVAADGVHSRLRGRIGGLGEAPPRPRRTAWRSLVEGAAAGADAGAPRSNLWLGPRAHLVHYPVAGGRRVNVVAIVDAEPGAAGADPWSAPGDPSAIGRRFAGWAAPARSLIGAAPEWRCWPLFDRPPLARWSRGAATLLGDAAHPMLPFLAQGAAQGLEDAAALGRAAAADPGDLPAAFRAYEAARRPRAARVQAESARQARVYHLSGPAALARDAVLRALGPDRLLARYDWLYRPPSSL